MKISFHSYANKTNFHMERFALSLTLTMRLQQLGNNPEGKGVQSWGAVQWGYSLAIGSLSNDNAAKQ